MRAARIDQLRAALDSSRPRTLRFGRFLFVVAGVSALATNMFGLQPSSQWTFYLLLTAAAAGLVFVTILFSLALRRLMVEPDRVGGLTERIFLNWIRRSFDWQLASVIKSRSRMIWNLGLISAPLLLLAPVILAIRSGMVGGIALAAVSLSLILGLLRSVWSREVSAPGVVQMVAPLVAVAAALSLGSWLGGSSAELLSIRPLMAENRPTVASGEGRTMMVSAPSQGVPAGKGFCEPEPWFAHPGSRVVARLKETWVAAGFSVAGCPSSLRRVDSEENFVAAAGVVGGRLRSLSLADRTQSVTLFGWAAVVAQHLLEQGELLRVPVHLGVRHGYDRYLIDTPDGKIALRRKAAPTTSTAFAERVPDEPRGSAENWASEEAWESEAERESESWEIESSVSASQEP